jgi:hypothetical protein
VIHDTKLFHLTWNKSLVALILGYSHFVTDLFGKMMAYMAFDFVRLGD